MMLLFPGYYLILNITMATDGHLNIRSTSYITHNITMAGNHFGPSYHIALMVLIKV